MEGNDVIFRSSTSTCESHCASGNNPFEEFFNNPMGTIPMSEQAKRRSSFGLSDFFNIGRSLSFCDFDEGDFGKESMGILPPDFGKDSLGFMNLSNSEFGRESLGILQIDALRDSLSFKRESLGTHNLTELGRESLDSGRESLGILHLKPADFSFIDEKASIPDILISAVDLVGSTLTASLNVHLRTTSSASSSSSLLPFNSLSLEGPSKIYSLSSMKNFEDTSKSDIFNKAFCNNFDFSNLTYANSSVISSIHSPFNKARLFSPNEFNITSTRIKSLPTTSKDSFEDESDVTNVIGRHFWTADRTVRTKTLEKRSFHGILDFSEEDTSSEFLDSVFIEAHHIAEKIADGSILNDSIGDVVAILDSTPQPEWPDESENEAEEKDDLKCNTETVFKNVDKLLPAPLLKTDFKIKTSKIDSNSSKENGGDKVNSESNNLQTNEESVSKPIDNISDIPRESKKLSVSRRSQSKSKDAKEILHNLSEILNCTSRSELQKSEGQNLLNSLADILSENISSVKNTSMDDSGHSSIIDEQSESPGNENHDCCEVVDFCTKATSENICNIRVSNKDNVTFSPRPAKSAAGSRLSQSLSSSVPNIKTVPLSITNKKNASSSVDFSKNKSSVTSNSSSVNSNDSKKSNNSSKLSIAGALRRKTFSNSAKKGPLKAVIPIGDMKKKNSVGTPERAEQKIHLITNRTSTPIREPKLKPMAASTPTGRPIRDKNTPSPLVRSKKENISFTMGKDKVPSPLPKSLKKPESSLVRRNSVSEMKRTSENTMRIRRCNSIEKETGIISSITKVRQNIVNSPCYQLKKQNILKDNSNIGVSNDKEKIVKNTNVPRPKVSNLESKLKSPTCNGKIKQSNIVMKSLQSEKEINESSNIQKNKIHKVSAVKFETVKSAVKSRKSTSAIEVKKKNDFTAIPKRRNSIGKELGIMSTFPKIRHNILNSPHFKLEKENVPIENSFTATPPENKESLQKRG